MTIEFNEEPTLQATPATQRFSSTPDEASTAHNHKLTKILVIIMIGMIIVSGYLYIKSTRVSNPEHLRPHANGGNPFVEGDQPADDYYE